MSVGTEWGGALGQAEGPASKQAGWVPIEAYSMELGPVPRFIHPSSNRGSHLAIWGCTTLECDWLRRVSSIQPQYTTIFKILQDIQLGRTHYGQSSKMLTGFLHQRFTTWTTQLLPIMGLNCPQNEALLSTGIHTGICNNITAISAIATA